MTHLKPAEAPDRWDLEADVVIVGYGAAGIAAAIEAADQGADVLVVERAGGFGGSAALSAGYLYLGGGTSLQRACGFDDTPDNMFRFLQAAAGPGVDEAKLRLYCDESADHFEWFVGMGVPFKETYYTGERTGEIMTDDGLTYSGGENAAPWNAIAAPVPRAHVPQMTGKIQAERSGGWLMMNVLKERADELGVRAQYDSIVTRLVVSRDESDRVVGLLARQYGRDVAIRARGGVVLAGGGFAANREMMGRYAPRINQFDYRLIGTDGDDGSTIEMAQAMGAAVRHMEAIEAGMAVSPVLLAASIIVNGSGQRFINEDTYLGRIGQAVAFGGGHALVITDDQAYEALGDSDRRYNAPSCVCGTLPELEQQTGLPEGSLQATVELYNRHAAAGRDPLFGKATENLRPLRAPFGAVDLREERYPLGIFTIGGLCTATSGEVLDGAGAPIPGLYAAGRATSGIPAWGYLSGTSLGDSTFFGRRAGASAARNAVVAIV